MAKRKTKVLPPKEKKKPKIKEYQGGMGVPNHNTSTLVSKTPGSEKDLITQKFPMLRLALSEKEGANVTTLAFFDECYDMTHFPGEYTCPITGSVYHPPTWMDPEIFVRMLLDDPGVLNSARILSKGENTPKKRYGLRTCIELVFTDKYLPYMFEKLTEGVDDVLAEFLVAYVHDKAKYAPKKKRKKRPAPPPDDDDPVPF